MNDWQLDLYLFSFATVDSYLVWKHYRKWKEETVTADRAVIVFISYQFHNSLSGALQENYSRIHSIVEYSLNRQDIEVPFSYLTKVFPYLHSLKWENNLISTRHIQDTENRTQDTGQRTQEKGHRTQDTGHRTQDTGNRKQDTGHRTHRTPKVIIEWRRWWLYFVLWIHPDVLVDQSAEDDLSNWEYSHSVISVSLVKG